MNEMNSSQIKYARNRAEAILSKRKTDLYNKYKTRVVNLTDEEKLNALQEGKFTISKEGTTTYTQYGGYRQNQQWYNRIRFADETQFDYEALQKEEAALQEKFTKLMDELMLGDNEQALALLASFEAE